MPFIPIGRDFVAEVIGIDLRTPLDADATAAIHAAIDRYAVLVSTISRLTTRSRPHSQKASATSSS